MKNNTSQYHDYALILSWPDATIRGDERWMMFFKKIGIVKNLNFKVGHTGIVIISRETGELRYYDFGRYISPRGYGRTRSKDSDPLLEINIKACFKHNKLSNLEEIIFHFEDMKAAMSGYGELYFSIVENLNFDLAKSFADKWVNRGSYPYGAIAKGNNNCSRFITRMLFESAKNYNWKHPINFPETIKASPISNIVNAAKDKMIYSYSPEGGLKHFRMSRLKSLLFLVKKIGENTNTSKAKMLPEDITIGNMLHKNRPHNISSTAQYLGGVGEGAWFDITVLKSDYLLIQRFTETGIFEYAIIGEPETRINTLERIEITYDSHLQVSHILQKNTKIRIKHLQTLGINKLEQIIAAELIA